MKMHLICTLLLMLTSTSCAIKNVTILHTNDIHGRFYEIAPDGGVCTRQLKAAGKCVGGVPRLAYMIKKFRKGPGRVIYLDAGDVFSGTNWLNEETYKLAALVMNELKPNGLCLGDHDFDFGRQKLYRYMSSSDSKFFLSANVNVSLVWKYNKVREVIFDGFGDNTLAYIGYVTDKIQTTAPDVKGFLIEDEFTAAKRITDILHGNGVKIIIACGHAGFEVDLRIATEVEHIDVVVGGHSHTFLYNGPPPDMDKPDGEYPKVIVQKSGRKVLVVQAYKFAKYLGCLNVTFDDDGEVIAFTGESIHMSPTVPQDPHVLDIVSELDSQVGGQTVGRILVVLDGYDHVCRQKECNVGNLVADALINHMVQRSVGQKWTDVAVGFMHAGAFGGRLDASSRDGKVSQRSILCLLKRDYALATFSLKGKYLLETLEYAVTGGKSTKRRHFLQFSGLRVHYDMSKPEGQRVVSVRVRCGQCSAPHYVPLKEDRVYNIVTNTFLLDGGHGHSVLKKWHFNKIVLHETAFDVLTEHVLHHSPVTQGIEGRIRIDNENGSATSIKLQFSLLILVYLSLF